MPAPVVKKVPAGPLWVVSVIVDPPPAAAAVAALVGGVEADADEPPDDPPQAAANTPAAASARPSRAVGRESVVANIRTAPRVMRVEHDTLSTSGSHRQVQWRLRPRRERRVSARRGCGAGAVRRRSRRM